MPVKFEIYREGKRLTQFAPVGAMAMGPESVPIPGEIAVKDGTIAINRTDDHAVGIALLWDVGQLGEFHLETTRLKPREQAYILNVELGAVSADENRAEDGGLEPCLIFPRRRNLRRNSKEAQRCFRRVLQGCWGRRSRRRRKRMRRWRWRLNCRKSWRRFIVNC